MPATGLVLSDVMRGHVERGEVAGVVALAARHGDVQAVVAGAMDLASGAPMRRDTIFRIASLTKPITAAAALILLEEGKLALDEPVDRWLPELADRRVLRSPASPIDDTVPARRAITVRDVLAFRMGQGAVMAAPGTYPIQRAIEAAGLAPGPVAFAGSPDTFMARLGGLPLQHQPGEQWLYHTGSDVLGVLIARSSGMSLGAFLEQRIFAPLGMADTAFSVPESKLQRLATSYRVAGSGRLVVDDPARGGLYSRPPLFESGGGGLVSTADDLLAFARMLLNGGKHGAQRILLQRSVELMTADHLTDQQKAASPFYPGFWEGSGWGFGVKVKTRSEERGPSAGSYGWIGGRNTHWSNDPRRQLIGILLAQRLMRGPQPEALATDFWTATDQAYSSGG